MELTETLVRQADHLAGAHPLGQNAGKDVVLIVVRDVHEQIRRPHARLLQDLLLGGISVQHHDGGREQVLKLLTFFQIRFDETDFESGIQCAAGQDPAGLIGSGNHETAEEAGNGRLEPFEETVHIFFFPGHIHLVAGRQDRISVRRQHILTAHDGREPDGLKDIAAGNVLDGKACQNGRAFDLDDSHLCLLAAETKAFQKEIDELSAAGGGTLRSRRISQKRTSAIFSAQTSGGEKVRQIPKVEAPIPSSSENASER